MEIPINIMTLVLASVLTSLVTFIAYSMLKNIKQSRYNEEKQRVELEMMRKTLEMKIYEINERLISNEYRWRDVNHLLLETSRNLDKDFKNNKIHHSIFLKSNGIDNEDLGIDSRLVFVLTPFNSMFSEDYELIKETCTDVGFNCSRGDEQYFNSDIFAHILKQLVKARIIIANLNGRNPNVLYELGIAQAMDKPVILLSRTPNEIPIDLRSKKFIIYKSENELKEKLRKELIRILNTT
ncbi:MAG: hypothetical protein R2793_00600 [Flavobacteriaceae bacterium]